MAPAETSSNPPSPLAILVVYLVLGSLVSFVFGREPTATLPRNIVQEMAPTLVVICGFLTSYSVWDVMAVGVAKASTAYYLEKPYKDWPLSTPLPERVYLAQRVQTNQVEQLPGFLVGAMGCALFVNGTVAAVLALVWAVLRRCYASTYRNGVGLSLKEMRLSRFTIPAYFVSNTMLLSTAIQALRCWLVVSKQ